MDTRWQRSKELFARALELSPAEREAFVPQACDGDAELLSELRAMLAAHSEAGEIFTAVERAPAAPIAAGESLGEYRILREIGRGGMGVVYAAEQVSLHRSVALKVLPASVALHPGALGRFQREAELAAKLDHPAVVRVLAAGQERGIPYLAMEWIDGLPLDRLIRSMRGEGLEALSGKRMGTLVASETSRSGGTTRAGRTDTWSGTHVEAACRIALQVADGLEQAHRLGVVHRDVKPANVLLRADGSAVLTDFGLAFMHGLPGLSQSGDVLGTPAYLSPEQARGRRAAIDHRTDQYSLGVTLYELLSLRRPHEVEGLHEAIQRIQTEEPLPLVRLNPRVPPDLATIVHKAIEKEPARRYDSTAALAADLRAFLERRPIAARPPSAVYRVARFAQRQRALIGGTAAVFVALVAGLVATGTMAAKARRAGKRESEQRTAAERELAVRTQVYEFLHDLLTDFQPGERDMSVRTLVDRASARAMERLGDDPRVAGEIHSMLGWNYVRLGDPAQAESHYKKRVELLQAAFGPAAQETLQAELDLAGTLPYLDRAAEGEHLIRRVLAVHRRELGLEHELTKKTRNNLAVNLWSQGRLEEAEQELLAILRRAPPRR